MYDHQAATKYAERFRREFLRPRLGYLQEILETNKGGNGFFVGDSVCNDMINNLFNEIDMHQFSVSPYCLQLTYADLQFVHIIEYLAVFSYCPNILNDYPKLKALRERVEAIPIIAAWIKERPKTEC